MQTILFKETNSLLKSLFPIIFLYSIYTVCSLLYFTIYVTHEIALGGFLGV